MYRPFKGFHSETPNELKKDFLGYMMSQGAKNQDFQSTNVSFNHLLRCLEPGQLHVVFHELKDNKILNNSQGAAGNCCSYQKCAHGTATRAKPASGQFGYSSFHWN